MIDLEFFNANIEKAIIGKEIKLINIGSDWLENVFTYDQILNGERSKSIFPYLSDLHQIGITKNNNQVLIMNHIQGFGSIYYLDDDSKIFHLIDEDYDWLTLNKLRNGKLVI